MTQQLKIPEQVPGALPQHSPLQFPQRKPELNIGMVPLATCSGSSCFSKVGH